MAAVPHNFVMAITPLRNGANAPGTGVPFLAAALCGSVECVVKTQEVQASDHLCVSMGRAAAGHTNLNMYSMKIQRTDVYAPHTSQHDELLCMFNICVIQVSIYIIDILPTDIDL